MKILSNKEYDRLLNSDRAYGRMSEAYRWLSEWDAWLGPMWDYLLGKTQKHRLPSGDWFETMQGGDIGVQREKMREYIQKQRVYQSFSLQASAWDLCVEELSSKTKSEEAVKFCREKAAEVRAKACELLGRSAL